MLISVLANALADSQAQIRINARVVLVVGVFREREEDEWYRQQGIERWQNAGRSILSSVRMVRNAETLADKFATGADRCAIQAHWTCGQHAIEITSLRLCCQLLCVRSPCVFVCYTQHLPLSQQHRSLPYSSGLHEVQRAELFSHFRSC